MRRFLGTIATLALAILLAGCASTAGVDREEPRRLLGRDHDVRVDAQLLGETFGQGRAAQLIYEIENLRNDPILVADLVPGSSYDIESRTVTINLGTEVPGNELIPRLIRIAPGEKKTVRTTARLNVNIPVAGGIAPFPRFARVRLNFLSTVGPFAEFVEMKENAVHDPAAADALFVHWVEHNRSVDTNAVPINWRGADTNPMRPGRN